MVRNDTTRKDRNDVDTSRSEDNDVDQAQEAILEEQVEAARQDAEARRKGKIARTDSRFDDPKDLPQEPEVPVQVPQHPTNPTPEY